MHIQMPIIVTMTMAVMVIAIMDLTVPSHSSIRGGNGSSVKICSSGVVHGWAAASVIQT